MILALKKEIKLRKEYIEQALVETIYFGGGTPSLLSAEELTSLIGMIFDNFPAAENLEITLEANPDDLSPQKVKELKQTLINRFSIGIQSFFEEDLRWMNRAHTAAEADSAIKRVQDAGFENITADLIYGYPLLTHEKWKHNIRRLLEMQIPHISSYSMTVEPKTALGAFVKKGIQPPMDEAQSAHQFNILMDELEGSGFEHYEISNFAKPGWHSKHNSHYWEGVSYLGIGPSAHSFDGKSRQWNVANNSKYIRSIIAGEIPAENEFLSLQDRINEYIMTSLRTQRGMQSAVLSSISPDYAEEVHQAIQLFVTQGWVINRDQSFILTRDGKLFADHIASQLFVAIQK